MHNQTMINKVKTINLILLLSYLLFAGWLCFVYFELGIIAAIATGILALALECTLIYELHQEKKRLKLFINWDKRGI